MRSHHFALALAMLAVPVPGLVAQTPAGPPAVQQQRWGPGNPVAALLDHQEQLSLSAEQVTRLESIRAELEQKNAPLMQQIGQARGERAEGRPATPRSDEEREAMRQRRGQLEPVMRQLRDNRRTASEQAWAVLTAEQQEQARALVAQRRDADSDRDGRRGREAPRQAHPHRPGA